MCVEGSCRGVGSLLLERLEVDVAELDRAALALQADRAAGRFGAVALVLQQAVDGQLDRVAIADDVGIRSQC